MNITIKQDNSRVEQLNSNSASIVEKLYELAIDPNNTLTLEGNISGNSAYADLVEYLTTNYPDLIINANKLYITFRDSHVASALLSQGVGDGTGITLSDLDGLYMDGAGGTGKITFNGNTDIEYFEEFKYFTNLSGGNNGPFGNCTNLKLIGFSTDYKCGGDGYFENIYCDIVIPSLKWYLEYNVGRRWRFPATGSWNINVLDWHDIYIGNTNNKLENPVVTSDMNVSYYARLNYTKIKTLTWESNSNIPDSFCNYCKQLTSVAITGQNIEIGSEAFIECTSLLTITGLSSIIKLHDKSFRLCTNLSADVSQLSNVTNIGYEAFAGCSNITGSLNLPNLVSLGLCSFSETGITSVQNLGSVTSIPDGCFRNCGNLTSVVLPNSCTRLQESVFGRCSNLSQINLSNIITEFGSLCFSDCSLLNISTSILTNATIIGESAFNGIASLSGDLVLSHLTLIGGWPFGNRTLGITSADFTGSTFTQIYAGLFENQTSLDRVILPATLTTVTGWGHFTGTPLRWIKFLGTTAPTGLGVNSMGIRAAAKIYVPDAAVNDYKASLTEYASLIYGMSLFATDFPNG